MEIELVDDSIAFERLKELATTHGGIMVKFVADVEKGTIAFGGEWHADAEAKLLEHGSRQDALWGANLFVDDRAIDRRIEYYSLINIRPRQDNRSQEIADRGLRSHIQSIVQKRVRGYEV